MMLSMVVASRIVFSRLREPPSWSITPFSFVRYAFLISSAASVLGRISGELVHGHVPGMNKRSSITCTSEKGEILVRCDKVTATLM